MSRSGFLLGVGGPAIFATLLVLPSVRASADREIAAAHVQRVLPTTHVQDPGLLRPVTFDISPLHDRPAIYATMPRSSVPAAQAPSRPVTGQTELPKPRLLKREGCEAPLSSLVGPEARRMVPGRCMV